MSAVINGRRSGMAVQTMGVYNIDLEIEGAQVGQLLRVMEVDETGRPTKWETVSSPLNDGSVTPEKLDRKYLELDAAGKVAGPLILKAGVHYGSQYPEDAAEGTLFLIEVE